MFGRSTKNPVKERDIRGTDLANWIVSTHVQTYIVAVLTPICLAYGKLLLQPEGCLQEGLLPTLAYIWVTNTDRVRGLASPKLSEIPRSVLFNFVGCSPGYKS